MHEEKGWREREKKKRRKNIKISRNTEGKISPTN